MIRHLLYIPMPHLPSMYEPQMCPCGLCQHSPPATSTMPHPSKNSSQFVTSATLYVHHTTPPTPPHPLGTIYHVHITCQDPTLTAARHNLNTVLHDTPTLLIHTGNIAPTTRPTPAVWMRETTITTDLVPHFTTPKPQNATPVTNRATPQAVGSHQQ